MFIGCDVREDSLISVFSIIDKINENKDSKIISLYFINEEFLIYFN